SSRRRHTRSKRDWSSDVCSSDLIVLKFLDCVFIAFAVRIIHLRPAGDPRFHQVPEMIKRNYLFVAFGAPGPLRARTDQAHVALEIGRASCRGRVEIWVGGVCVSV